MNESINSCLENDNMFDPHQAMLVAYRNEAMCRRACGAVVGLPSRRLPARVRFPVWDRPGVAPGFIPREGTGVRVYRCVVCVRV